MNQYFGNHISLSIEGGGLRYFAKEEIDKYYNNKERSTTVDQPLSKLNFHSNSVNISLQNVASTNHNMNLFQTDLRRKHILRSVATLFCFTNSCSKKYRCIVAMYLLSILAQKHSISIERIIGA